MTTSRKSSVEKLRVVFDTSVLVAAALRANLSQVAIEQARDGIIYSVTSPEILNEFQGALQKKSDFSRELIEKYVTEIEVISTVVQPIHRIKTKILRDESDNKIIECALAGKANMIISLDKDLLSVKAYNNIGIVHPRIYYLMHLEKQQ